MKKQSEQASRTDSQNGFERASRTDSHPPTRDHLSAPKRLNPRPYFAKPLNLKLYLARPLNLQLYLAKASRP